MLVDACIHYVFMLYFMFREYNSNLIEQINTLSHLAKAYISRKEYSRAYLANLEQLNAAEEIANDCWHEVYKFISLV